MRGTSVLSKLLGLILLRRTMSASTSLLEGLLTGAAAIFVLGLVFTILIASLIAGGIYVSYNTLVAHGMDPLTAGIIIGSVILLILAVLFAILIVSIIRIGKLPKHFVTTESEIAKTANRIIDAFMAGFEGKPLALSKGPN